MVTVPLSRRAREDGRRGQGSGQFAGLVWRRWGGGVECLARADRVTRARWWLSVVVLGWQARDQLADPAELLERGLHLAPERRIFEYLAGVGVGDRLSVADERLALLCQLPEGLLDVVEAG